MINQTAKDGKTWAIVSHLTFVGLIIAVIMNMDKRNAFTSFYNRQMLGLVILLFISQITDKYINGTLGYILWIISAIGWLFSFIHILKGEIKPIPYIGEKFQEWFRNIY